MPLATVSSTINDPIHGIMGFTKHEKDLIKPIIDSASFQRLRHIKQLGMADLVFPGATHTRFSHCIGACYLSKLMCDQVGIEGRDKDLVMVAALLHDVGHGPFSHAFENLFKKESSWEVEHEDWTPLFLNAFVGTTSISSSEVDVIANYIRHSEKKNRLSADIISSQLDADRLDYLLRDSHFCGVSYGVYDLKWLINSLVKVTETVNPPRLGISRKGIGAIEHYLMARRFMTQNVYYHGKVKAAEFLLIEFLRALKSELLQGNELTAKCSTTLVEFLKAASTQQDKNAFLASGFTTYQRLCDYDIWATIRNVAGSTLSGRAKSLADRIYSRKLPVIERLESSAAEGAEYLINECRKTTGLEEWQLSLLNLGVKSYKSDKDPILVKDVNDATKNLQAGSFVMGALADKTESTLYLLTDAETAASNAAIQTLKKSLSERNYLAAKAA